MEKWLVLGAIWATTVVCLALFVRGSSPAMGRAVTLARIRNTRLRAEHAQREALELDARSRR